MVETIDETVSDETGLAIRSTTTTNRGDDKSVVVKEHAYDEFGNEVGATTTNRKYQDGKWLPDKVVRESYRLDYMGNIVETTTGESVDGGSRYEYRTEKATYDKQGQLIASYDYKGSEDGHCTKYEYDLQGQLVKTMVPVATGGNGIEYYVEEVEYDAVGRVTVESKSTTADGMSKTEYGYDLLGNTVLIVEHVGDGAQYTQYLYDKMSNQIRQYTGMTEPLVLSVDQNNQNGDEYVYLGKKYYVHVENLGNVPYNERKYEYDQKGVPVKHTDPVGRVESHVYDIHGNLIKTLDKNKNVIRNEYDNQNRITRTEATSGITGEVTEHVFEYDAFGSIRRMDNVTYEYGDASGALTREFETEQKKADIESN